MKNKYYFPMLLLVLCLSCNKDGDPPYVQSLFEKCIDYAAERGKDRGPINFVEFEMQNKRLLYSEMDGAEILVRSRAQVVTTGSELNLESDTAILTSVEFNIRHKFNPSSRSQPAGSSFVFITLNSLKPKSVIDLIDEFLKVGSLPLVKESIFDDVTDESRKEGFAFEYWCIHCCDEGREQPATGNYVATFESIYPDQAGYINCTKFEKEDLGSVIRYQVDFEFGVNLYARHIIPNTGFKTREYELMGQVKDGKMSLEFELEK